MRRPIGDYRGGKYEDQFQWQESSFHGGRYWVKNYSDKGQGRVNAAGDEYWWEAVDYRSDSPARIEGVASSLGEAQKTVDDFFSE